MYPDARYSVARGERYPSFPGLRPSALPRATNMPPLAGRVGLVATPVGFAYLRACLPAGHCGEKLNAQTRCLLLKISDHLSLAHGLTRASDPFRGKGRAMGEVVVNRSRRTPLCSKGTQRAVYPT